MGEHRETTTPTSPSATVTDHRPVPRGVLPRGVQTWIMAGLAVGMLAIMLIVGRPDPPKPTATAGPVAATPTADRVRDYQDRLRLLEARAAQDAQAGGPVPGAPPPPTTDGTSASSADPIAVDRKRREYESLFASNVAWTRRPDRPDSGRTPVSTSTPPAGATAAATSPSVDEVADAVVRATARTAGSTPPGTPPFASMTAQSVGAVTPSVATPAARTPEQTDPISAAGPRHRLLEGTVIDTVLTNRLDGTSAAPVNCLVTNPVLSHNGQQIVIPAGARVLGDTKPVQMVGETRLAVSFHRLVMPDGRTYRLDQFLGLNQIGDAGLRDQVNQHYWSTFGAAAAVGLISGLSQYLGSAGLSSGDGNRTVVIAGGIGEATSQATLQVMNRFLNRLPTITIREGHRVKVYLTSDLELPAYPGPSPRTF